MRDMLEVNKIYYNVQIIDYSYEGLGVARINNIATFIPHTKLNEEYNVKIVKVNKNYAYGQVINPCNNTNCEYYNQCGGCQIRHLSYQEQIKFKENVLQLCLAKNHLQLPIASCVVNDLIDHYRNKVIIPLKNENGKIVGGYYQQNTHHLIAINNCLLISQQANEIINSVINLLNEIGEKAYDEDHNTGNIRNILIREGFNTNSYMVCLVTYHKTIKQAKYFVNSLVKLYPQIKSIVINYHPRHNNACLGFINYNLYNCNFIEEKIDDIKYRIEPNTFFQINTLQAQKLYHLILKQLQPKLKDVVLDAYCGVGSIGCYLAKHVSKVIGIEINNNSIKLAKINAKNNNINNIDFICNDLDKLNLKQLPKLDKIILDPPRSGLSKNIIKFLLANNFQRIIYVSCNPVSLGHDLKQLQEKYDIQSVIPVDMFSNTYHLESITTLVLK